jgi:hypothetical protein
MAADNVTANPGASGSVFRTLSDGTNEWPASVLAWPTTISPGANVLQLVDGTHGLPVAVIGTVVLGAGAAAVGTVGVTSLPSLPAGSNTIGTVNLGTIAGIALDATVAKLNVAQGGALGSNTGPMVQGSVTTAAPSYTTGQVSPVSLTTAGLLRVDASGTTVPVSGTFFQATQPVSGTFWQATQPVSGTVTANAGTGTFAVSGTVSTNADAAIGAGAAPSKSLVVGGVFNSSAPAPTTGQTVALQLDSTVLLKVNVAAGGASGGTSSSFGSAFPATGTAIGFKDSTGANLAAGNLDASGFLKVNVAAGSGGNGAASATGSAVPASADYSGLNVAGTLCGQTGANPSGSIFAAQTDLSSIAGTTADTNSGTKSAGTLRVVLATDQPALTNALKVDGSAVTQPISGAVTQASGPWTNNLTQFGGTNVATGTGIGGAGIPRVTVSNDSNVLATQSGTWNIGTITTLPALAAGANTIGAVTQASGPWTNNVTQVGGTAIDTNSGTKSAGTIRMVLATDQPALTNALKVDGSAVTQPVSGTVTINAIPAGTNAIGTVQPGNTANTTPWLVTDTPATSGGLSFSHVTSAASNNKTQAKASAGQLFSIMATNTNAAVRYLKIFNNTSAGVTMGTTAADYQFAIPGNTAGAGLMINIDKGIAMGTGITYAITAAVSLTDNTSISANDCCVTLGYK